MIVLFQAVYYTVFTLYDLFRKTYNTYKDNKNNYILNDVRINEVISSDAASSFDSDFDEVDLEVEPNNRRNSSSSLNNLFELSDLGFDHVNNSLELAISDIINETVSENCRNRNDQLSHHGHFNDDRIDENQVCSESDENGVFSDSPFDITDDVTLDDVTYSDGEDLIDKFLDNYLDDSDMEPIEDDREYVLSFDPPVYIQRYSTVSQLLLESDGNVRKIIDFGCAEFGFFNFAKKISSIEDILLVDIDPDLLDRYVTKIYPLNFDYLYPRKVPLDLDVMHGSISLPSQQYMDVDAVICIEIIEHLYPDCLEGVPYNIFGVIRPKLAVFTTPNADFNIFFPYFKGFRHDDHKFEWTREQFEDWSKNITIRFPDYTVTFVGIGYGSKGTEVYGACSQMAVFRKQTLIENIEQEEFYKEFFDPTLEMLPENECLFCKYQRLYGVEFFSLGVCTYESKSYIFKRDDMSQYCEHYQVRSNELETIAYPYDRDERPRSQKILHNAQYNMHRLGGENSRFYNYEMDKATIPMNMLTTLDDDTEVSESELSSILKNSGYEVKLCDVEGTSNLCVIYDPHVDTMSRSSHRTHSIEASDINYEATWDHDSNWDNDSLPDDYIKSGQSNSTQNEGTSKLSESSLRHAMTDSMVVQTSRNSKCNLSNEDDLRSEVGESSTNSANTTKVLECIYDSGMQLSNSSVEMLSPEFLRNFQVDKTDKKRDITFRAKSESENNKPVSTKNQLKKQTINMPVVHLSVMKSDGNIKLHKSGRSGKITENTSQTTSITLETDENQVQNAPLEYTNITTPEVPNLFQSRIPDITTETTTIEGEDGRSMMENFSREVLFDRNSNNSLSDIDFVPGEQNQYHAIRITRIPTSTTTNTNAITDPQYTFPAWLLHLLNSSETESMDTTEQDEPHFYSQGDGLGIHPSISDLSTETSSSGTSIPISTILVLGAGTPGLSDNDLSDEYYSIHEDISSARQDSNPNFHSTTDMTAAEANTVAHINQQSTNSFASHIDNPVTETSSSERQQL